jgi:acyl-CoA reductase-like NAD-dependent aldehyde dehydrogenase
LFRKWKCDRRSSSGSRFPEGIFQNLEVGHKVVKEILEHDAVKGVSLTGSGKAGGEVASIAGLNIKKSLLELGGSDAFIIFEDGDLEAAAKAGAKSRLQNCGQTCTAAKRFILDEKIEDQFLPLFIEEYKNTKLETLSIKKPSWQEWQDLIWPTNWKLNSKEHWKMVLRLSFLWKEFQKMNLNQV